MVNKLVMIGFLGKEPEVRRLDNGQVVAKFSLATNESYKDKSGEWVTQTEWHDIIVWRQLAERAEKTLKKGMQVYVEGKLTHRTWEDKDGNKRKTSEVVANTFRILGKREEREAVVTTNANTPPKQSEPKAVSGEDDDLPF